MIIIPETPNRKRIDARYAKRNKAIADARLRDAAPDLLNCLVTAHYFLITSKIPVPDELLDMILKTIIKAKGEY